MKFFFIYLSFSRFFLPSPHKIIDYWDNNEKFGFYDAKGDIYEIQNNTFRSFSSLNPFIKEYKFVSNYSIVDYISKNKISSLIEKENDNEKLLFSWGDTTLYQTMFHNNIFFRINYFGKYLILKNKFIDEDYITELKEDEYLQYCLSFHSYLVTINNYNELSIYHYTGKEFEKKIQHYLFYKEPIKKIRLQKLHNYIYMNILYRDNLFKSLTFFHDESENKFRYLHQNDIIIRDTVIDFNLKFPYVYILTDTNIQCYLLKTFDNFSQLKFKRFLIHNYQSIYYFNEKLYLTGEKSIDFFEIKKK